MFLEHELARPYNAVALQECRRWNNGSEAGQAEHLRELLGPEYSVHWRKGMAYRKDIEGLAILSRLPVKVRRRGKLHPGLKSSKATPGFEIST